MRHQVYAYPRLINSGLGNLLFPWARCEVFAEQNHISMLAPQWVQPRLGPLMRGELDWRYYNGLFASTSYVRGPMRLALLLRADRVPEDQASDPAALGKNGKPAIVEFRGMKDYFHPLMPHRDYLRRRLMAILRDSIRQRLEAQPIDWPIAVHVRRGDMKVMRVGETYPPGECVATPMEWFVGCIRSIRKLAGSDLPVRVFSDGSDDQLRELLALANVSRAASNPSIVDIFLLSRSPMLVTTCGSTFSGWACYLGEPTSFWYPSTRGNMMPANADKEIETDFSGNLSPEAEPLIRRAVSQCQQLVSSIR